MCLGALPPSHAERFGWIFELLDPKQQYEKATDASRLALGGLAWSPRRTKLKKPCRQVVAVRRPRQDLSSGVNKSRH